MKRKTFLVAGIISLALIVMALPFMAACAKPGPSPAEQSLKVCYSIAYTGYGAAKCVPFWAGSADCAEYINKELGGVSGHLVDYCMSDTAHEPDKVISDAKRIMDDPSCLFMFKLSTRDSAIAMELTNRREYPIFDAYCSATLIHPPTHVYVLPPGYDDNWIALTKYYLENLWPKNKDYGKRKPRMAMHMLDNPTGWGPRYASMALADELGVEIVADEEHTPTTVSEMESLTRIKGKNPDVLLMSSTVASGALIVKNAVELGIYPGIPILLCSACFDKYVVDTCGAEAVEGIYGVFHTALWGMDVPIMAKMTEYCKKNNPDHYLNNDYVVGWAAGLTIAEILRVALENVGYDELTPQNVEMQGFRKVKDFNPGGLTGKVGWTDDYDRRGSRGLLIYQIQEGKFVPVSDWIECPSVHYEDYDWFKP